MIMLTELSQDELKYICDRIPTVAVRYYFQKNSKEFAKIRPGFRAEKLSDADTHSILFRNTGKKFISTFIEHMVSEWLNQIENHIKELEEEGYTAGEALIKTIPDSVFCDKSDLYFKVSGIDYGSEYLLLFRDALSLIQKGQDEWKDQMKCDEEQRDSAVVGELTERINELESEIGQCTNKEKDMIKKLQTADMQIKDMESSLQAAEDSRVALEAELEHYRNLSTYADEGFEQDEYQQFQHVSIGQISYDYSGQIWINRLADIVDGEIWEFFPDDTQPHYFENRDRLYWKNGPDEVDAMGIWSWKADPRDTDPFKDFITCEFNSNARVTEVVELPECKTLAEIAAVISEGIEYRFISEKVLFCCTTTNGAKEGLLCYPGDIEYSGGVAKLTPSVFLLSHYSIRQSDTMKIAGVHIYRKMNLGMPQSVFRVRAPYDAVKGMLLSKVTIPALREQELTKKEAQKCKRFLEAIPTQTIIQELMDAYECSEEEAEEYVTGFIEHANTYLSKTDIDMSIVSAAIERNPNLVQLCKELLTGEWEAENAEMIDEAKNRLEEIKAETDKKTAETQELIRQNDSLVQALEEIGQEIERKEQLAENVEKKITERIEAARRDAADFISEMAFVSPVSVNRSISDSGQFVKELPVLHSRMTNVVNSSIEDIDTFEEEFTENLMLTGYEEETAIEMTSAISYGICNRVPVVINENATAIGECLAATMGGKELTQIFFSDRDTDVGSIFSMFKDVDDINPTVLLLHGVLDSYNVSIFNALTNFLQAEDRDIAVLLSLEGITANMISPSVWNRAVFVDGDEGMTGVLKQPVHGFIMNMRFKRTVDSEEYRTKKKEMNSFSSLFSNLQMNMYAKLLSTYGISLNESRTVLHQMITASRSAGTEEKLQLLFHERGISNGEKIIAKYL